MPREAIPPKVRWYIFKRDGFRCRYCGAMGGDDVLVVDHVNPVARGGRNNLDNLITACERCNQGKGDSPYTNISEFQIRQEALDCVNGWLERAWAEESKARWSPREMDFLTVINQAYDYAEAEKVIRVVASCLRGGAIRADADPALVCEMIVRLADWLNVSRASAEMHDEEYTAEMQARDWRSFWQDEEQTLGLLDRGDTAR